MLLADAPDDSGLLHALSEFSAVISVLFPAYLLLLVLPLLVRRTRRPGKAEDYAWHLFVPCRDEEAVIGDTLAYLRASCPTAHLWVVDDDSEDGTGDIVRRFAIRDPGVHLVQRRRPEARQGKGEALNAAYRALCAWLPAQADRRRVIVGVFDADGRPAPGCLDFVAARRYFGRQEVGGVQIEVRMLNRTERHPNPEAGALRNFADRLLIRMQDLEFRAPVAALQHARKASRSVCLGGNGQFVRLAALDDLNAERGRPWTGRLLEDFELGMHLLLAGWINSFCAETYVEQEALYDPRRFLTQRTRWAQGVMQCFTYIVRIWRSDRIPNTGFLELSFFLAQPWLQLIGALLYPVPLMVLATSYARHPHAAAHYLASGGWIGIAAYLVMTVGQFVVWGPIYRGKCERDSGFWQSIGWGLAYPFYLLSLYVVSWRAVARIVTGRNGWAKTRRNAEGRTTGPVAKEA
ncbi:glycosyltransferase family 2 protein [Streptomyces sp. V4-01]|uniref:Glycosyltransferase family 2 protein n=1 Tax=Actinacidiphila polyblastidii TaxID=3110430 RepID=A0ABU7PB58_9ACTN|nr:glycosyltransferase family 2 protein [Streptomyces sp. V4-01]